ncbi:MAG: DnaD domain protein [Chloroflexi bacterium]|nr:DnaD domain protein [Chloroflexota bacterium]
MGSFQGFPDGVRFTPVPSPLFGELLEEMDDLLVLKCLLRVIWHHSQKKGFPRFVTWGELAGDRSLVRAVSRGGSSFEIVLGDALDKAAAMGALLHRKLERDAGSVDIYVPNTQEGRRAIVYLEAQGSSADVPTDSEAGLRPPGARPNIFSLYEENVGMLTPMIAEELRDAESTYPQPWVEDAFREAVALNRRSWRYIEAILKRWKTEGREHGESGRHTKKVDAREWIRRHGLPRSS